MFIDRVDAGRRLAERLAPLLCEDVMVLGLPRGGVPVAFEVARALGAPLDIIAVRKLGVPFQSEVAMGAIGEGGIRVINTNVVRMTRISADELTTVEQRERAELRRRARRFRGGRARLPIAGKTAIVIDDGIATGATARAACRVARSQCAARVVLAVPVASPESIAALRGECDQLVCLETPPLLFAIGQWYSDFSRTSDKQVVDLLRCAERARWSSSASVRVTAPRCDQEVEVLAGTARLAGQFLVPDQQRGIVVFAQGSGNGRHSPRNHYVAKVLNQAGFGTLLFDLLTQDEALDRATVYDIDLLADRLLGVTSWLRAHLVDEHAEIGYFGESTGAAAALWASARAEADIGAVVSLGGRPDLAVERLADVRAATLLVVGERDESALAPNRMAAAVLRCEHRLTVVPGAADLFEEAGALELTVELTRDWFVDHLARDGLSANYARESVVGAAVGLEQSRRVGRRRVP